MPQRNGTFSSQEAREKLIALKNEGKSLTKIAEIFSEEVGHFVSRGAVAGKLNRIGEYQSFKPREEAPVTIPKMIEQQVQEEPETKFEEFVPDAVQASEQPLHYYTDTWNELELEETSELPGVTLLQLEQHHCRWPFGDPVHDFSSFRYCGEPRVQGESYCTGHYELGTNPLVRKKKPRP